MSPEHLLTATLTPVEPRPEFVRELKAQLMERARITLAPKKSFVAPRWLWVAAGVGGLVSIIGMTAFGLWRARATRGLAPQPQPTQ